MHRIQDQEQWHDVDSRRGVRAPGAGVLAARPKGGHLIRVCLLVVRCQLPVSVSVSDTGVVDVPPSSSTFNPILLLRPNHPSHLALSHSFLSWSRHAPPPYLVFSSSRLAIAILACPDLPGGATIPAPRKGQKHLGTTSFMPQFVSKYDLATICPPDTFEPSKFGHALAAGHVGLKDELATSGRGAPPPPNPRWRR